MKTVSIQTDRPLHLPVVEQMINVVSRTDIRSISSVIVNGQTHTLGEQRDFRRNQILNQFMPENGRYSLSWVKLKDGETLANHKHPTKSMIIVCKGSVFVTGDSKGTLYEGDIVCVPPGRIHGFKTRKDESFEGLSIQFEGEGLYENEEEPRVDFNESTAFNALYAYNQKRLDDHQKNSLFNLFKSGRLQNDPAVKERFIAALYVFSKFFQKMIYARQTTCNNKELYPLFWEHLKEEFGHDKILFEQNDIKLELYDPILEAASNWFVMRMLDTDEAQKIVIVHMVVESSGQIFGATTKSIFNKHQNEETSFFELHAEADDDHSNIGLDYLKNLSDIQLHSLKEICTKAWDQMDLIHERIASLTLNTYN